jgi:ABC-type multidrug transport system permease subunit
MAVALSIRKPVTDALAVTHLDWIRFRHRGYIWTAILLALPLAMLYFARNMIPPGFEPTPRLIAGSIVLNLGITLVQGLAQDMNFQRFFFRLKLIQVCPVHPLSYALGSLAVPILRASIVGAAILLFAPLFGISIHLSLWLVPAILLTALSMAGIAFIIGTWAPAQEIGNMISTIVGVLIVMVSPIYFPASRLPGPLETLSQVSPYTHAADALDAILSNRAGFYDELAILVAITAVTMTIGLAGMRWREA